MLPFGSVLPAIPKLVTRLPVGPAWSFEMKLDGFRAVAYVADGKVRLQSKPGNDFTSRWPALQGLARELPAPCVLDGEVLALDEAGRSDFGLLMRRQGRPMLVVFDLLALGDRDLRSEPLSVRRDELAKLVLPPGLVMASPVFEDGPALFAAVLEQGLEGVVAKRVEETYAGAQWQKVKNPAWREVHLERWGKR